MAYRACGTPVHLHKKKPHPVAGMVAGAAIGAVVAGPVGAVLGAGLGCAAGSRNSTAYVPSVSIAQPTPVNTATVLIRMPPEGMEMRGGTQYFSVDVTPVQNGQVSGQPWRVLKRYSDFESLRTWFENHSSYMKRYMPAFPRKHITGCAGRRLDHRRFMLEAWLQAAVPFSLNSTNSECIRGAKAFLSMALGDSNAANQIFQTGPAQIAVVMPIATPLANRAAAPVALTNRAAAPESVQLAAAVVQSAQAPGEILEIQVPEGCQPGQVIAITVPDGRQATLKLPNGVVPGSALTLLLDSVTGTLSAVDRSPRKSEALRPSVSTPAEPVPVETSATVLVQVPAGVGAGQMIAVTVPSGRQVNFTLPEGATEGQMLRVWYDPISNTLMHLG